VSALTLELGAEVVIDYPSEVTPPVDDPHAHWIVTGLDGGDATLWRLGRFPARTTLSNLTVARTAGEVEEIYTELRMWLPLEIAPVDGTAIIGRVYGEPVPMRWAESRVCMLADVAPGAGLFDEGWEDTLNGLVIWDGVDAWRPVNETKEN
jgi:hypothetical protein